MNEYLLLRHSLYDLTNLLGHNLMSVPDFTNPLGHRLISALVFTSHLKCDTILLILLCLDVPFLTAPGCFCLASVYLHIANLLQKFINFFTFILCQWIFRPVDGMGYGKFCLDFSVALRKDVELLYLMLPIIEVQQVMKI